MFFLSSGAIAFAALLLSLDLGADGFLVSADAFPVEVDAPEAGSVVDGVELLLEASSRFTYDLKLIL